MNENAVTKSFKLSSGQAVTLSTLAAQSGVTESEFIRSLLNAAAWRKGLSWPDDLATHGGPRNFKGNPGKRKRKSRAGAVKSKGG